MYPGDRIGYTDIALLARAHRSDGLILRGDRPAFSLDVSFVYKAFGAGNGPDAKQITATYTRVNGGVYHVVLVAEESHAYTLTTADLNVDEEGGGVQYVAYSYHNGTLSLPTLTPFSRASPLSLSPNPVKDGFTVWYASPVLANGMVMVGETGKWVPVSRGRVAWMAEEEDAVVLGLMGGAMEAVTWTWAMPMDGKWMVMAVTCKLNEEGRARLVINMDMTTSCFVV